MQPADAPSQALDRHATHKKLRLQWRLMSACNRFEHLVVQVRTVVLIALPAMSRKFLTLVAGNGRASTIAAPGFVTLALAIACWLLRTAESDVPRSNVLRGDTPFC